MSAVPAGKAGVGSAVNDTTREFGGALGIAVTGSLMSSLYRAGISTEGLRLTPEAAAAAGESVGAATTVARTLSRDGAQLAARAIDAFAGSYRIINVVCAVLALAGALGVARLFPQRKELEANQSPPAAMPEPVGAGSSR
jgi:DHA2 family multidrug resistance protein-like MFS transporter